MCPCTVASLKRTGSIAVAVNLSPARDCLLEIVSFNLIFRFVPIGTIGFGAGFGAAFLRAGLVCALIPSGKAINRLATRVSLRKRMNVMTPLLFKKWFLKSEGKGAIRISEFKPGFVPFLLRSSFGVIL